MTIAFKTADSCVYQLGISRDRALASMVLPLAENHFAKSTETSVLELQ
jgi:hypothetical protein